MEIFLSLTVVIFAKAVRVAVTEHTYERDLSVV
jgi:hypothetical protein